MKHFLERCAAGADRFEVGLGSPCIVRLRSQLCLVFGDRTWMQGPYC